MNLNSDQAVNNKVKDAIRDATYHATTNATMIACGNEASKRLIKLKINHFKLPHPSPRNR